MKRGLVVFLVLVVSLTACKKKGGNNTLGLLAGGGVTIKGDFNGGTHAGLNILDKLFNFLMPQAYALSPGDVTKVIVIGENQVMACSNKYYVAPVSNGTFTVKVDANAPVGIIFSNDANQFLGYLTLGDGLDSLPLNMLDDSTAVVDLQTLASTGSVVEPGHNPIGNEIILTNTEKDSIKEISGMFGNIVRNPDVDGDGLVDIMANRSYYPYVAFNVNAGSFGASLTPVVSNPVNISDYCMQLSIKDKVMTSTPSAATLTGPAGSGITNQPVLQIGTYDLTGPCNQNPENTHGWGMNLAGFGSVPISGIYTVNFDAQTLSLNIPDLTDAKSTLILPVPTVVLNADGTINKITWAWQTPDGSTDVDTVKFLDNWGLASGLVISGADLGDYCPGMSGTKFQSGNKISSNGFEYVLPCQSIPWAKVTQVTFCYFDIYENRYDISFAKP